MSKGAMLVKRARRARTERYDRWHALLLEEIDLVAPRAQVFAIGGDVARHLERRGFSRPFTRVIHYSRLAGSARAAAIVGREAEFERFKTSVTFEQVVATARDVLNEAAPRWLRDEILARLAGRGLSDSQKRLLFAYKVEFESSTPR